MTLFLKKYICKFVLFMKRSLIPFIIFCVQGNLQCATEQLQISIFLFSQNITSYILMQKTASMNDKLHNHIVHTHNNNNNIEHV